MTSRNRDFFTLSAHQRPSVGDTKTSAVDYDHLGWLLCDGRLLNKNQFGLLFNVVGYSFGGSNDYFALPEAAGRVPAIKGTGTSLTPRNYGDMIGSESTILTIPQLPEHNHGVAGGASTTTEYTGQTVNSDGAHTHTQTTVNDDFNNSGSYPNFNYPSYPNYDGAGSVTWANTINSNGAHTHSLNDPGHFHTLTPQGSNQPFSNYQPTIFMGNLFIYSGKSQYGSYPLTANTNIY